MLRVLSDKKSNHQSAESADGCNIESITCGLLLWKRGCHNAPFCVYYSTFPSNVHISLNFLVPGDNSAMTNLKMHKIARHRNANYAICSLLRIMPPESCSFSRWESYVFLRAPRDPLAVLVAWLTRPAQQAHQLLMRPLIFDESIRFSLKLMFSCVYPLHCTRRRGEAV